MEFQKQLFADLQTLYYISEPAHIESAHNANKYLKINHIFLAKFYAYDDKKKILPRHHSESLWPTSSSRTLNFKTVHPPDAENNWLAVPCNPSCTPPPGRGTCRSCRRACRLSDSPSGAPVAGTPQPRTRAGRWRGRAPAP